MQKAPVTHFDLNQTYGIITVSGEKSASFLQGQLTADIQALQPLSYQWSAYCNLKGRVRAVLRVWPSIDGYCLLLSRSILTQTIAVLKQYGRFSKITIDDRSMDYSIFGFRGTINEALHNLPDMQLLMLPDTTIPRWIGVAPKSMSTVTDSAQGDIALWNTLDIRAGIPDIFPETIDLFLPHHIGLMALNAVSLNKGCFCGQEVIARMEYRSMPKRQLAYLQTRSYEGSRPIPGTLLYADPYHAQSIGTVVNATQLEGLEMLVEIQKDMIAMNVLYLAAQQDERLVIKIDHLNVIPAKAGI